MTSITTTTQAGALPDLIKDGGEVRVLDTHLAKRLGYERPRAIRQLIARHRVALSEIAPIVTGVGKTGKGQAVTASYLNEAQALFILAKSETARANIELAYVAEVFTEYRRGNLVAKDADTQARLDAAEAARQARIAEMREDKAIRRDALRMIGRGRSSSPRKAGTAKARKG